MLIEDKQWFNGDENVLIDLTFKMDISTAISKPVYSLHKIVIVIGMKLVSKQLEKLQQYLSSIMTNPT